MVSPYPPPAAPDFFSGGSSPVAVTPAGQALNPVWQQQLEAQGLSLPQAADPETERRRNVARALFTFASSLGQNTQNFLPALTTAVAQGGNTYIAGQEASDQQRRADALEKIKTYISVTQPKGRNQYGNMPVSYKGPDGKIHLYQPYQGGGLGPELTPGKGYEYAPTLKPEDTGTEITLINPKTGGADGTIPKNNAGEAAQKKFGEDTGQKQFDLPRVQQNAGYMLQVLDGLDKSLTEAPNMVGPVAGIRPEWSAVTGAETKFTAFLDQAQGQQFLQAYETLKGGGSITEVEGQKATAAMSRLQNRRLSPEDYSAAINELRGVIQNGLARAKEQAGQAGTSAPLQDNTQGATAIPQPQETQEQGAPQQPGGNSRLDTVDQIPDGAVVRDDDGNHLTKRGGQMYLLKDNQAVPVALPGSQQDYDALPSGAIYTDPGDGKLHTKP